jgi:hypothetical protein
LFFDHVYDGYAIEKEEKSDSQSASVRNLQGQKDGYQHMTAFKPLLLVAAYEQVLALFK